MIYFNIISLCAPVEQSLLLWLDSLDQQLSIPSVSVYHWSARSAFYTDPTAVPHGLRFTLTRLSGRKMIVIKLDNCQLLHKWR